MGSATAPARAADGAKLVAATAKSKDWQRRVVDVEESRGAWQKEKVNMVPVYAKLGLPGLTAMFSLTQGTVGATMRKPKAK